MNLNLETRQTIRRFTADLFENLVTVRRELHQHPELSGQETWTANYLAEKLGQLELAVQMDVGGHGLVADLITDPSKPAVALRVDMDALPIHESNNVPYRSQMPGVMHACGHDVHSTIGLGTAAVLTRMVNVLSGNIRFIFQPEEEEITGALRMIRAGALANPTPCAIFGLHVAPLPAGQVAWSGDLFLAGFEHYLAILTAREASSASPEHLDAVAERCCQVIRSFNDWQLPENWEEMQSFWHTLQEGPHNLRHFIIYDATLNDEDPSAWHGQFGIGIKAANRHLRRTAVGRIKAILNTICRVTHTDYRLEPMGSMPDMRNHPGLVKDTLPALTNVLGPENVLPLKAAFPFNCEDFAYYTKHVPGAMYWLGAADPTRGKYALLHTPDFDVDERCLETGTIAMATLLLESLSQGS